MNAGWTSLSGAFLHSMPNLCKFHIGNDNFDDDACVAIAKGLNNKNCWILCAFRGRQFNKGWKLIENVLCDTSSLYALQKSNHTLKQTCADSCPPIITKLLE